MSGSFTAELSPESLQAWEELIERDKQRYIWWITSQNQIEFNVWL